MMINLAREYGWSSHAQLPNAHIAEEYGWTKPSLSTAPEMVCSECGRLFTPVHSAGVCYCERCVNYVLD